MDKASTQGLGGASPGGAEGYDSSSAWQVARMLQAHSDSSFPYSTDTCIPCSSFSLAITPSPSLFTDCHVYTLLFTLPFLLAEISPRVYKVIDGQIIVLKCP